MTRVPSSICIAEDDKIPSLYQACIVHDQITILRRAINAEHLHHR